MTQAIGKTPTGLRTPLKPIPADPLSGMVPTQPKSVPGVRHRTGRIARFVERIADALAPVGSSELALRVR